MRCSSGSLMQLPKSRRTGTAEFSCIWQSKLPPCLIHVSKWRTRTKLRKINGKSHIRKKKKKNLVETQVPGGSELKTPISRSWDATACTARSWEESHCLCGPLASQDVSGSKYSSRPYNGCRNHLSIGVYHDVTFCGQSRSKDVHTWAWFKTRVV